jgi:signal transduction histidine kinase/CheY-like chemotaxis protein
MKPNQLKQWLSFLLPIKPKQRIDRVKDRGIPLKMLLLVPFLLQIFTVAGLVGWLSWRNGQQAVEKLANRFQESIADDLKHRVEESFISPQQIELLNLQDFESGSIDPDKPHLIGQKFLQQMQLFELDRIYFALPKGDFIQVNRQIDNSFTLDISTSVSTEDRQSFSVSRYSLEPDGKLGSLLKTYNLDPRSTVWYKKAQIAQKNENELITSIVPNEEDSRDLYVSVSSIVYHQGKQVGTLVVSQSLQHISQHLGKSNKSESGAVFIIEPNGYLVASSDLENLANKTADGMTRVSVLNSQNPIIQATGKYLQSQFFDFKQITTSQKLQFTFNGEKQFVEVHPWRDRKGFDCLLVIIIPAGDFLGDMKVSGGFTVAVCFLALGVATLTTIATSEFITRPISRLGEVSRAIALKKAMIGLEDHLKQQLTSNNIHEVRLLSHSFHDMVLQLQDSIDLLEDKVRERTGELTKAKEIAELANRSKSDFLANMSHEVRTPLNAILGFCQLMRRDTSLKQEHQENLEIIIRSGEHLLSLINDVLDLSKIEAGRVNLWENDFDLYATIGSITEMLLLRAETKGLDLWYEIDPNVPQYVRGDEKKLRQILINLIGNSIKFTDIGKIVLNIKVMASETVSLISDIEVIEFSIEDTGIGIAPEEIDSLFDPFTQSKSGRDSQQGTGLGLSIVKQFVNIMSGEIGVRSELNKGSCFTFHIPLQIGDASQIVLSQDNRRVIGLQPNQPNYRIMVVDDRWENRQLMFKLLTVVGFDVKMAENGREAVSIWSEWEPHLIWMDMRMPVMNGYEAVEAIRNNVKGQASVIIALTASTFEEERMLILSSGCDDFVRKPFLEETIFEKMRFYLGVQYTYEDSGVVSNTPTLLEFNEESLGIMSENWLLEFKQASIELDREEIDRLLELIPPEQENLARAITQQVNNFEFDRLIYYTTLAMSRKSDSIAIAAKE